MRVARIAAEGSAVQRLDATAIEPFERTAGGIAGEPPETYPTGV